jgi:hypothetical protein
VRVLELWSRSWVMDVVMVVVVVVVAVAVVAILTNIRLIII